MLPIQLNLVASNLAWSLSISGSTVADELKLASSVPSLAATL